MEKIDLKKLMEADEEESVETEPEEYFDDVGEGDDFGDDLGEGDDFGEGDDSFDFGDDSFDEELDIDDSFDEDELGQPEEDIVDRIKNFINSKSAYINKDGEVVTSGTDVSELEASDDINDNIKGFLAKIKDPAKDMLQYVEFDKDAERYNLNVDLFFRKKVKLYNNLNAQEKLDRIQDDLYYLINKFRKIYDKNIALENVPNELFPSLKNKFGDLFHEVYSDIELDKYDNYLDSMTSKTDNEESSEPSEDKSDEEFVWEKNMKHNFEKIELPTRLDEDNYYAKSKGELLEFGFIEKEGWYVFMGQFIKIAVNIDFDVVITTNFEKVSDSEFVVTEKTFTNNVADGIIFSSGIKGHINELMEEIEIMKNTFEIADKVKAKLFG